MLHCAVVGTGYIGRRHCQILQQHPDTQLLAVADTKAEAMQGLDIPQYPDLDSLLQHSPAQVVHLCTPNYLHTTQALQVLQAGRHVVIEKPMGLDYDQCRAVADMALRVDRKVFVVMQNRFTPTALWLKQLLAEGHLGKLYMVQVNCFWNRDDRYYQPASWKGKRAQDGGVLFTQFSHFVDILYWLLGDLTDLQATMDNLAHRRNTDMADSGHVLFRLQGGALGSLHFTTAVYDTNLESSITLVGERGTVRVAGQYMNELAYCHIQDYPTPQLPPANPPNLYGLYQGSAANHHYIIQNVVDTLVHGATPSIGGDEGAEVVRLIQQMYRAAGQ